MTPTYTHYQPMIYKLAHNKANYNPATDFDSLVSEGNLAFVLATKKFDPALDIKFSTYLFRCADYAMRTLVRNESKNNPFDTLDAIELQSSSRPERETAFKEWLTMLSEESQFIIGVVWDTPADIIYWAREESYCPKVTIKLITKHLRRLGWKWDVIRSCYREIRTALKSF